jgi:hypothetical protein
MGCSVKRSPDMTFKQETTLMLSGRFCAILLLFTAFLGCRELGLSSNSTWHEKCGWKAEDYFDDPQVVALCKAIEANDLEQMKRLIATGANVNATGKGNMTPLLWAFPDNKLERFQLLLEHGADPNVATESDFGTHGAMRKGDSVNHMACATAFPGYFEAVFDHGGDPNLIRNGPISGDSPLFSVIIGSAADKQAKVRLLIDRGVDLNHMNGAWKTPAMQAVSWGAQYQLALMLLQAGADHTIHVPKSNSRLIHQLVGEETRRKSHWTPQQKVNFDKLVAWLEDRGESLEEARRDNERWKSWSITTGEYERKMAQEVAERKAREVRKKEAKEQKQPIDAKQAEKQ